MSCFYAAISTLSKVLWVFRCGFFYCKYLHIFRSVNLFWEENAWFVACKWMRNVGVWKNAWTKKAYFVNACFVFVRLIYHDECQFQHTNISMFSIIITHIYHRQIIEFGFLRCCFICICNNCQLLVDKKFRLSVFVCCVIYIILDFIFIYMLQ